MDDYLEFEKDTKAIKSINLDDFSIEDLKEYIKQLNKEMERVKLELNQKMTSHADAENILNNLFAYFYTFKALLKSCNLTL